MSAKQPSEKELLKQVLEPLLDDFIYWFSRSLSLLESEKMPFLAEDEQTALIAEIKSARDQVSTAKMLFKATEGEAGIDSKMLLPWHNLVARCWDIAKAWRQYREQNSSSEEKSL